MIGNISYCRGTIRCGRIWNYLLKGVNQGKSELLTSNVINQKNLRLSHHLIHEKSVLCHLSISFDPADKINSKIMRYVGEDFICRYINYAKMPNINNLVYSAYQGKTEIPHLSDYDIAYTYQNIDLYSYSITRHHDCNHPHMHLAFDCYDIVQDQSIEIRPAFVARVLTELLLRQIEKQYGFRNMENSWVIIAREGRKGKRITCYQARKLGVQQIKAIKGKLQYLINHSQDWNDFISQGYTYGITIKRSQNKLLYQVKDVTIKAEQLGEIYTLEAIEAKFYERQQHTRANRKQKSIPNAEQTRSEKASHSPTLYQ